ncbi:MAG: hypothetical protein WCC74_03055 [Minisyncoccia bacterium]
MVSVKTIISHHVRINLKGNGEFEKWLVEETFDLGAYITAQTDWALKCPYNRNGVKERYGWDDAKLDANPKIAVAYFIEQHGNDWFRDNRRSKFITTKQVLLDCSDQNCPFSIIQDICKRCPDCKVAKLGIVPENILDFSEISCAK